jgi:hypothetical protein
MNKLEQKFENILNESETNLDEEAGMYLINKSKASNKSAELTKDIAVKFSLWTQSGDCEWQINDYDEWFIHPNFEAKITTEELFDKYCLTELIK